MVLVAQAIFGVTVLYFAKPLSERYNAWTTRLRERYPQINPPPTPEMRKRNTQIMTWLFRFIGAFFVAFSAVLSLPILFPN